MFASIMVRPMVVLGQDSSTVTQGFSGNPEDVPFSSARIFSKIVAATGMNPNADWSDSFGQTNDEDVGKDLYITIYRKVNVDPQKKALTAIAAKYGMTETDLNRILHSDYTTLMDKKPTMTQQEAQKKIMEIQQLFKEESELQNLEANVKASVEPSEIFANMDIDDSGFDLVNDLDIIEKILFLKTNPIDIGQSYDSSDEEAAVEEPPAAPSPSPESSELPELPPDNSTQQQTQESQESQESTQENTSGKVLPSDELDPLSCFAGDEYKGALDEFDKKAAEDKKYKKAPETKPEETEKTGSTSSALTKSDDFLPIKTPPPSPPIQPAPAGDWLQDDVCDDVFCIFIESITVPATSKYSSSDNCIACHAEKINETLKKLISHTLSPNKAPGNLMESGKCKSAMATSFGSVSMNFYASSMPVKTPQNDDIIYGKQIEDDWYNYCSAVAFPFGCPKAPPGSNGAQYTLPTPISNTVTQKAILMAADGATYNQVNTNIQKGIAAYGLEQAVGAARVTNGAAADTGASFFGPIKTEMDNMTTYFVNFSDILQSLNEAVETIPGSQACVDLKNKKECT